MTLGLAGQTIAVHVMDNQGRDELSFVFSDHLGSPSMMTDHTGAVTERSQHLPFGGMRSGTPSYLNDITDAGYTGHKENSYIKLQYMNARYFVPGIGRFLSADTIVPDPLNPQALNRYSYVNNRPINMVDPSGHCGVESDDRQATKDCWDLRLELINLYGIDITGTWSFEEMVLLSKSFDDVKNGFGSIDAVRDVFEGTEFARVDEVPSLNGEKLDGLYKPDGDNGVIYLSDAIFANGADSAHWSILHEMGHRYDHYLDWQGSKNIQTALTGKEATCSLAYCQPEGKYLSPYDRRLKDDRETFAQAFALAYFTGDHDKVVATIRVDAEDDVQAIAIEYIKSLQVGEESR